ncbi:MAG: hypothetical protein RIF41_27495 [Polyangiaceae bacterium]
MVVRQALMVGGLAAAMIAACGGGAETSDGDGGAGGFITGAGGGPQTGTGVPTTTGTGTGVPTTTTGAGGTGGTGAGTGGTGGTGTGSTCTDIGLGEPNESEATAWPLKSSSIEDCDGDGDSFTGTIGPGDVDWLFYEGDDTTFCIVNPERTLSQSQSGLRLCKFFECLSGQTEVGCPSGTTPASSPEQRPGCCGTSGFEVSDLNCTGTADEHVYVYIRLDQPGGDASTCNDYSLAYHY